MTSALRPHFTKLLGLAFLFISVSLHAASPKEALLIANGKYSHFAGLAHPPSDAEKLQAALEQLGFRVRVVRDGNREQMLDAINDFEQGLRNTGAIAFFHYGGHGVQVDGKNYLLPADSDIPDERRVATRAVALDEVMTAMDAASARASIIVIDACRDNPLPAGAGRNLARGLSVVGMKPKNSIVIYAAEAGSKALDGLFTPILAMALQKKGKTIDQVMKTVRSEVYAKSNGQQTPGEYNQLFEELFLGELTGGTLSPDAIIPATPSSNPNPAILPEVEGKATIADLKIRADQGDAEAQKELGNIYIFGEGVPKDAVEAVKWWRKAADQGYDKAQNNLGLSYELGDGVPKDMVEALKWYRMAAEQGLAMAQVNLGACYERGEGVMKSPVQAEKWYRKAAEQGMVEALVSLGFCYYNRGLKNPVEAVKWWRKAADQGNRKAQNSLGVCYERGEGVPKDMVEAVKWYRKAAEQGDVEAQVNIGFCYEEGKGVPKDMVEAVKWWRKAAEQGDEIRAPYFLGLCYEHGEGVPKDAVEAYAFFNLASLKNELARESRDLLAKQMTSEQIAAAQMRMKELQKDLGGN